MQRGKAKRKRISELRKEALALMDRSRGLLERMLRPGAMMPGYFYGMYKKCGRESCWCAEGKELHGPYPVVAIIWEGKRSTRSVRRDKVRQVRERTERYRAFQRSRRRLREMIRRIERILDEIRDSNLVNVR